MLFAAGKPCALDEEKVRLLTELGVEWRMPKDQPRKSTGGEASRKKRKRADDHYHEQEHEEQMEHHHHHHAMGGYRYGEEDGGEDQHEYQGMAAIPPPGMPVEGGPRDRGEQTSV